MTEWQECRLDDYLELAYGKSLTASNRVEGEFPVYGSGGISGSHNEAIVKGPGIIVGRKGTVGSVYWENKDFFPIDTVFYVVPKGDNNLRFIYYLLKSLPLEDMNTDAAVPGLNRNNAYRLDVPDISLGYQNEIADVLGSIDQKIELNQRMNETLEGMARSIFKSWFVDFDPVHAKAEGREPEGMDSTTAALFPSAFTPDALPEGWEEKPFSKLINLIGGGTPKTSINEYWNGDIPWFSVVDAPNESDVFVVATEKKITDLGVQKSSTKILQPNTTIISARGTVGRVALTGVLMAMNQSCYGITGNNLPNYYTYFCVKQLVAELKSRAHGSVFDTITRETFETISFVTPTKELAKAYDENVKAMMQKILCNLQQNQTLAALRDTLLPKLISGELRVDTATEKLKEAVG